MSPMKHGTHTSCHGFRLAQCKPAPQPPDPAGLPPPPPQAQLAFGSMGIPVLMAVLRDDRGDTELMQGALEALVAATAAPAGGHGAGARGPMGAGEGVGAGACVGQQPAHGASAAEVRRAGRILG